MRINIWHLLFILAALILLVGQVYRHATRLPSEYLIPVHEVVHIQVAPYTREGAEPLIISEEEEIEAIIEAYNSAINYRESGWGTMPGLEMTVELTGGDTFFIRDYTSRVFWVSVEREGKTHEFRVGSRELGREFARLRQHF